MKSRTRILKFAVAGAFLAPLTAFGQGAGTLGEEDFRKFDANRDGVISRSEWSEVRAAASRQGAQQQSQGGKQQQGQKQAQQEGQPDGQWVVVTITPVEQRIMDNQRRESLFRALDGNGDGTISAQEAGLNVQLLNAFADLDQNRDGIIERQEFAKVHVQDGSQQAQGAAQGQGQAAAGGSANR